mmetsp:Transcript_22901/g.63571  ORF Transcript_22901/g.63571 Transcript_22901/m.63571 type:complete len:275 (+) Transcript_22901:610-1434(+)
MVLSAVVTLRVAVPSFPALPPPSSGPSCRLLPLSLARRGTLLLPRLAWLAVSPSTLVTCRLPPPSPPSPSAGAQLPAPEDRRCLLTTRRGAEEAAPLSLAARELARGVPCNGPSAALTLATGGAEHANTDPHPHRGPQQPYAGRSVQPRQRPERDLAAVEDTQGGQAKLHRVGRGGGSPSGAAGLCQWEVRLGERGERGACLLQGTPGHRVVHHTGGSENVCCRWQARRRGWDAGRTKGVGQSLGMPGSGPGAEAGTPRMAPGLLVVLSGYACK